MKGLQTLMLLEYTVVHSGNAETFYSFTSFTTVLQSYQDDERVVMKGFEQWKPVMAKKMRIKVGPLDL